ncbi:MAG TPA: cytochrome c oxidase accessory protein CcoG [Deltaproteobacteria bacterium]|nr:cytochrome c oxidase accessory protein CcoG [Deltaproteobacteria bacterium]
MSVTAKRVKVYPRSVKGKFRTIRWAVDAVLLGVYFALPWIKIDGRPALLLDIPGRKFYIFNTVFWPQEAIYLAFLLLFLAIALFLFTAVAGRLWCGYACPQTVFTDVFIAIERLIEGDRRERMELDRSGWTARKVAEKALLHSAWLLFSFATAFTFVAYFVPPEVLIDRMASGTLTTANIFWLSFFTLTTYGDCGFFREIMCLVPCPYGRFQSALFDADTLIIGYDRRRGEPRGPVKKGGHPAAQGDCIDCTLCVQVCPTGIDIRKGLQYECIACAQCIDACNAVMRKVGKPGGLIRYGSMRTIAGGRTSLLRPRVVVYAAILLVLFGAMSYKVATRVPLDLDILRDRTSLYRTTRDGRISNLYTIKAINRDTRARDLRIKVTGIKAGIVTGANPIHVEAGEVYQTSLVLIADRDALAGRINRFDFVIEDVEDPDLSARRESTFYLPDRPRREGKRAAGKDATLAMTSP